MSSDPFQSARSAGFASRGSYAGEPARPLDGLERILKGMADRSESAPRA